MDLLPPAPQASEPTGDELFSTLFSISVTGVVVLRPVYAPDQRTITDFVYVRLNPAAQQLLSLPEVPATITLRLRYPHPDPTGVYQFCHDTFVSGQPGHRDVHYQHNDLNAYLWVAAQRSGPYLLVSVADSADFNGLGTSTPLRRTLAQEIQRLYESNEQPRQSYEAFMQQLAVIIVFSGPDHICRFANNQYTTLVGHRVILGHPVRDVAPAAVVQPFLAWLNTVYTTGQPLIVPEASAWPTPSLGETVATAYFTLSFQPIRNQQGKVEGVTVFAYDITQQRKTRLHLHNLNSELASLNVELSETGQQLANSQREMHQLSRSFDEWVQQRTQGLEARNSQLTHMNQELDSFVYSASHDLRAPIANLEGLLNEMERTIPADHPLRVEMQPLLRMMHGSVLRFQQTIGHLTELSRVPQEGEAADEPLDLAAVIADVQLDLAAQLAEADAQVLVEVENCGPILLSHKHLRSIVYNLLSNALKYRHPNRVPQIRITCEQQPGAMEIQVQDNGLGLSPEQQQQLFGLFRRLHHHVEGSGVGLFLIKRMIENAGGQLSVRSTAGVGSTFIVRLPTP
ncbi:PAS domain-containing sensor histidine kinase [Hymenobacter metallilatus]|uniref:histidine kinase n=1 Tax=Hymenobacter metallilatus TaxID=2493666 RepID=A0A3R9NL23_9BACT|nr:PAS domain-containing sensor histidine kinase [Hymenobacter metallilatus]RSK35953.1 PAS domain-containing sensor histidine kinase [Hymenobacter metallilatus]